MAAADKNIVVRPRTNSGVHDPEIQFTGNNNSPITLEIDSSGTLNFNGSAGTLFSISNDLTGTLFAANDVSGVPLLDADDQGLVRIAPHYGTAIVGATSVDVTTTGARSTDTIQVTGRSIFNGNIVLADLPEYDTNALASSLDDGTVYKTSTGELRIKV